MPDTRHRDKHHLLFGVPILVLLLFDKDSSTILVLLLLVLLHPVYGFSSYSKSSSINFPKQLITFTPSGSSSNPSSSTSSMVPQTPSTTNNDKDSTITTTIASTAVITCMNSTIKNALIDALVNRPLVNVNGSIRIDPTFVNHTVTDIIGCINKIENGLTSK